ncbi:MAG: ribonuclease P protein component [Hyphomonadaceae bacterium]
MRQGAKCARPLVLVEARRRAAKGPIRLGLTATKKIGGAVVRNRARRRLREAARALLPEYGLKGVDYVLVARAKTPAAPWAALLDDVRNALISVRADLGQDAEKPAQRPRDDPRRKRLDT